MLFHAQKSKDDTKVNLKSVNWFVETSLKFLDDWKEKGFHEFVASAKQTTKQLVYHQTYQ